MTTNCAAVSVSQRCSRIELLESALYAFQRATVLKVLVRNCPEPVTLGHRAQMVLTVLLDERALDYVVVAEPEVCTVDALAKQGELLRRYGDRGLLIIPHLKPLLAQYCLERAVQAMDARGNAFLFRSGLFAFAVGDSFRAKSTDSGN
jgi:hypothetical protein